MRIQTEKDSWSFSNMLPDFTGYCKNPEVSYCIADFLYAVSTSGFLYSPGALSFYALSSRNSLTNPHSGNRVKILIIIFIFPVVIGIFISVIIISVSKVLCPLFCKIIRIVVVIYIIRICLFSGIGTTVRAAE